MKVWLARWPKIVVALVVQLFAVLLLALGVTLLAYWVSPPYADWALVLAQALLASLISVWLLPYWWRWIQLILPIAMYVALLLEFSPLASLAIFVLLWLVFRNAVVERVPLYLTNQITRQALKQVIKHHNDVRFIDLGCGLGANVVFMQTLPNVKQADGVETAPLPYLWAKLRSLFSKARVYRQDIWDTDLSDYDLVYAFLSPEPMSKLWQKVIAEMSPGAVFVSNSFAVDGVEPSEVWQLADKRQTQLYIYRIAALDAEEH